MGSLVLADEFDTSADLVLYQGNCLDLLSHIPDEFVKLVVTSPPYNLGKPYESRLDIEEYLAQQEQIIQECIRVLADTGSICWQVGNYVNNGEIIPLDMVLYPIFSALGLKLRNRIVWQFGHGLHATKRFSGRYEVALWFTKSNNYTFNLDPVRVPQKYPDKKYFKGPKKGLLSGNPLGKNPGDIWDIPNVKANHVEKTIHPCQFPVELVERCVLALTNEKDWVLDPYCGVGSTLIAAVKNNRKAVGCDKEEKYITIAKEKIGDYFLGKLKTRPIGKPIFTPTGREKVSKIPSEWKIGAGQHEDNRDLLFQQR